MSVFLRIAARVAGAMLLMGGLEAHAEPASESRAFNVLGRRPSDALIDFALQAEISISTASQDCGPKTAPVVGRMSIDAGLAQLLAPTKCSFIRVDRTAYKIVARQSARSAAPPEIIVTATKRRLALDRAPYSVSTIPGEDLVRAGATGIGDLQSQVSGLTVTNMGSGRDKIFIRGLSDGPFSGRTQSTVGIYLDEAPITYNAPDPDLKLVDVDRVEILRGPQGTLYGAGSTGGVVHIVTNKPDVSNYAAAAAGGISGTASGGMNTDIEGAVNIPIVADKLAVRLVGYREKNSGYIDDIRLGLSNVNESARNGFRYAALWKVGDDWELTAGGVSQSIDLSDTQYEQPALGSLVRANNLREPHDNDFQQNFAVLTGAAAGAQFTFSGELVDHDFDSRYDATEAAAFFGAPATGPLAFGDTARNKSIVLEATASSSFGSRLSWLAGAFFSRHKERTNSQLFEPGGSANIYQEDRVDHIDEVAIYAETTLRLTAQLSATGGFRAFSSGLSTNSRIAVPSAADRIFAGKTMIKDIAPKFVLADQISDSFLIYAQAVEGYRLGGFNTAGPAGQVFADGISGTQPNHRFRPDELWSYELGAKIALLGGKLHLRSAAYYAIWTNIQTDQFLPSGLPYTANVGDGDDVGFEMEASWTPSNALSLTANLLVDSPELTKRNPSAPSQSDVGLPGVPDVSGGFSFDYRHPLTPQISAIFSMQYAYVGSSQIAFEPSGATRMGGYSTERIAGGIQLGAGQITLYIDNPLNIRGNTFAFGNPFSTQRDVTPLRPRTIGLLASWHY